MFNFCPMCGADIRLQRKLCNKCGLDLRAYKKKLDNLAEQFESQSSNEISTPQNENNSVKIETKNIIPMSQKVEDNLSAAEFLNKGYLSYNKKEYENALKFFIEAAKCGSSEALYWQARMFDGGQGVEKDKTKALDLYQKAVDSGSINALFFCGCKYISGKDGVQDTEKGWALVKKAADNYEKVAYAKLATESNELSTQYFYIKRLIELKDEIFSNKFDYLFDGTAALKHSYDEKNERCYFKLLGYRLPFEDTILPMGVVSKIVKENYDECCKIFKEFYEKEGNIKAVVQESEKLGLEILMRIAERAGVLVCTNLGKYDVTAKDMVIEDGHNLVDIDGKSLSNKFVIFPPARIWKEYSDRVRNKCLEIMDEAQSERDRRQARRENRDRWEATGGYNFVDYMFNSMKAGTLNAIEGAAHRAFNSIGDLATGMSESSSLEDLYKNPDTLKTYFNGLSLAVETLKLRIFALVGCENQFENSSRAWKTLENLKKVEVFGTQEKKTFLHAIMDDPLNLDIYKFGMIHFNDPECEFEKIAVFTSLRDDVLKAKHEISIYRLKTNSNVSDALKNALENDDPVKILSTENISSLKQDFEILKSEVEKMQLSDIEGNKIFPILEIYKNIFASFENDEKVADNTKRLNTFEHSNENMEFFEVPEGVTEIGSYAFANCSNLMSVTLPSTLKKIEVGAFYNCPMDIIELPNGVAEVSINLKNEDIIVYLPNSLERITGNYLRPTDTVKFVFDITSMPLIDDYFKKTGRYYELVYMLTEEEARNSLIKDFLLTQVGILPKNIFNNKEIFPYDGFTVSATITRYVLADCFANSSVEEISFGSYLRVIEDNAFKNCDNLKKLILPKGTEYLGDYICADCKNLKFLFIPDTVKHIGKDILSGTNAVVYCSPEGFVADFCRKNNIPFKDGAVESYKIAKKMAESSTNATEMQQAFIEYVDSAEMGSIDAAYEVGKCYMYKLGVNTQDTKKAFSYFETAANAGHKDAMFELYKIYNKGCNSISQNTELAQQWLIRSEHDAKEAEMPAIISSSKIIKGYEETLNYRDKLFEKYGDMRCIYFAEKSQKSINKINKALNSYAGKAGNEIILLLYDDTLFGSATDGFLITNKAIYYHNLGEEKNGRINFGEISNVSYDEKSIIIETYNSNIKIGTVTAGTEQTAPMSRIINEIKEALLG